MTGLYEILLDKITEPVCVVSGEGLIEFANKPFSDLCLIEASKLLGTQFHQILPQTDSDGFIDMLTSAGWRRQVYLRQIVRLNEDFTAYLFESQENVFLIPHLNEVKNIAMVAEQTANAVVITDALGYIEWVNDGFTQITGYQLEEVYGHKPGDMLQGPLTDVRAIINMREKIALKVPFEEEVLNYAKDGSTYWLRLHISPVFDDKGKHIKFVAIETDITKEIQNREQLYNLSLVANYANELVAITDKEGLLIWANEKFAQLLFLDKNQIVGKQICDLICEDRQLRVFVQRGESFEVALQIGQDLWQLTANLVNDRHGYPNRFVFVFLNLDNKQRLLNSYEEATLRLQQYE